MKRLKKGIVPRLGGTDCADCAWVDFSSQSNGAVEANQGDTGDIHLKLLKISTMVMMRVKRHLLYIFDF